MPPAPMLAAAYWVPACSCRECFGCSAKTHPRSFRVRLDDFGEQIRPVRVAFEVRIALAIAIIEPACFEGIPVFDEEFDGAIAGFGFFDRSAKKRGFPATIVRGDQFHARPDPGAF